MLTQQELQRGFDGSSSGMRENMANPNTQNTLLVFCLGSVDSLINNDYGTDSILASRDRQINRTKLK